MFVNLAILNAAIVFGAPFILQESFLQNPVKYILASAIAGILFCLCQIRSEIRQSIDDAIKAIILGTGMFYALAILYGALLLNSIPESFAWSLWMSTLTLLPATLTLGPIYQSSEEWLRLFRNLNCKRTSEAVLLISVFSLLLANWLACMVIPLDWGRVWQRWPIPNVLAGSVAYLLATLMVTIVGGGLRVGSLQDITGKSGTRARKIPIVEVDMVPSRHSSTTRQRNRSSSPTRSQPSSTVKHVTISPKKTFIEPVETLPSTTRSKSPAKIRRVMTKEKSKSRSVSPSSTRSSRARSPTRSPRQSSSPVRSASPGTHHQSPRLRRSPRRKA